MKGLNFNMKFKVVSVSDNSNSFGLKGMIIVNEKGLAYEVGANGLNIKKQGEVINIPVTVNENTQEIKSIDFAKMGFEIPRKLDIMPKHLIKQVWDDDFPNNVNKG